MGKLTATSFITFDNVVVDPHLWSGDYQSEDTGVLNDSVLRESDAMVLGRTTYEGFAAAWPSRSGDPFSDKFNSMPKYVVSTTLRTADWNNTTILAEEPFARIRELKADQNLLTWGSPSLVQGMLDEGLVDELVLLYSPIVLGKGKRLFGDDSQPRAFKLMHSAVSPYGLIAATYVRNGEVKTATVGGANEPSAAELARREKLKREG